MASALATMKGKFLLCLNDLKEVRRLFRDFDIRAVQLRDSAGPK
jgi:hypothetical protein